MSIDLHRCYSFRAEFMFFYKSVSISLIIGSRGLQCTVNLQEIMYCKSLTMSNLTLDRSFKVKLGRVSIKVPKSHLLLVLEVSNVQLTCRKPYAGNLLVMSNLTLDLSFKVKLGWVNIKVPISRLLLVPGVCNVQ